jgi:hypothetical protein
VPDEVVNVTGDPAPLRQEGLMSELASRCIRLRRELCLTRKRPADSPREGDAQNPDATAISDGSGSD